MDNFRSARKIRTKKEIPNPNPDKLEKTIWEEAVAKGLIEAGMTVKFEKPDFTNIHLEHDECGVDQVLSGKLTDGIVTQISDNDDFYIVTFAKFDQEFILKGRFANAFGEETIKKVLEEIANKTSISGIKLMDSSNIWSKTLSFIEKSKFFLDYFTDSERTGFWLSGYKTPHFRFVQISNGKFQKYGLIFDRDTQYSSNGCIIILCLKSNDAIYLDECIPVKTNQPITRHVNHFEKFIII